jgi:hypothetical protein
MGKITQTAFLVLALLTHAFSAFAQDADAGVDPDSVASYQKAADAIAEKFMFRYSDAKGAVDYPAVFNALGSLAGYGCQMAVRESFITPGIIQEDTAFYVYKASNGQRYYLSTLVDAQLEGNDKIKTSVLTLVNNAAQESGVNSMPDFKEISQYNFKTMGTDDFGIPRIAKKYTRLEAPVDILIRNWLPMKALFTANHVDSKFWGWTFALAAHDIILKHHTEFDPATAEEIVMEAAIPMSTINPASLRFKR